MDEILPDNDWLSGVGCKGPAAARSGVGVDQAAMVKQTMSSVARQSEGRNRIKFPPIRFRPGYTQAHEFNQSR